MKYKSNQIMSLSDGKQLKLAIYLICRHTNGTTKRPCASQLRYKFNQIYVIAFVNNLNKMVQLTK